jgi:hypothetical protein
MLVILAIGQFLLLTVSIGVKLVILAVIPHIYLQSVNFDCKGQVVHTYVLCRTHSTLACYISVQDI